MKSTRLVFDELRNTRDLGGMLGADGRRIKNGMLIRSGQLLEATAADQQRLSELINVIVDFRTKQEAAEQPDPEIKGVRSIHSSVLESLTTGISWEMNKDEVDLDALSKDPDAALSYMKGIYSSFPVTASALNAYRTFLDTLLENSEKAVLWHCTAGKDRAGFAAVIIEYILGVSWENIKEDYLYTNECIVKDVEFLKTIFIKDENSSSKAVTYMFTAQEDYLDSAVTTIYEKYGGFDSFIREALGMTDETIQKLRNKYLEEV